MAIFNLIKRVHGSSIYFKFDKTDFHLLELNNYDEIQVKIISKKRNNDTTLRKFTK